MKKIKWLFAAGIFTVMMFMSTGVYAENSLYMKAETKDGVIEKGQSAKVGVYVDRAVNVTSGAIIFTTDDAVSIIGGTWNIENTQLAVFPMSHNDGAFVNSNAAGSVSPGLRSISGKIFTLEIKVSEDADAITFKDAVKVNLKLSDSAQYSDDSLIFDKTAAIDITAVKYPHDIVAKDSDGKWYYYYDGQKALSFTGFADNSTGRWRIEKGKVNFNYQNVANDGGKWRYYSGGKWQSTAETVAENSNGWWYVKGGVVQFDATDVVKRTSDNSWWYVKGGKVQSGYTGFADNSRGRWRIEKGKVNFNYQNVANDGGEWRYYSGGRWQMTAETVAENSNGWWYVKDGVVQFDVTSVVKRISDNTWWYVKNGKVQSGVTNIVKRIANGSWWYVKKGQVQFGFTGIANRTDNNSRWYVKEGRVQTSYSGTVTYSGKTYTIVNGKVTAVS